MKKFLPLIFLFTAVSSCGLFKHTPKERYVDVIRYVDSTMWHDTTIYKEIPVERIINIIPVGDSSFLETSMAESNAWVDTLGLHHTLKNKEGEIPVKVQWKEKVVYKDSIQVKEKLVPYKVVETKIPKSYWWLLGFAILTVVGCGIKIGISLKKK